MNERAFDCTAGSEKTNWHSSLMQEALSTSLNLFSPRKAWLWVGEQPITLPGFYNNGFITREWGELSAKHQKSHHPSQAKGQLYMWARESRPNWGDSLWAVHQTYFVRGVVLGCLLMGEMNKVRRIIGLYMQRIASVGQLIRPQKARWERLSAVKMNWDGLRCSGSLSRFGPYGK